MSDVCELCQEACNSAFADSVKNLYRVFYDCLITAKTEDDKKACKKRLRDGMKFAKEVYKLCLEACKD